ncbi:MAG: IS66 family transposase, partial [Candidatus Binatia bacterium]
MVPVYAKPNARKRRPKPGARDGHPGVRRERPVKIDEHQTHRLKCCPHCRGQLQRCKRSRTRIIEDIPEAIEPVVTEHTLHRDYCPKCKKHVEPAVPDAMPGATLGRHVVALTAWFHYGRGITIDNIVDILGHHLHTTFTSGGLIDAWRRLAEVLNAWYDQIGEQAKKSTHLHADETGWRVNGVTYWLWCFANTRVCYYLIDRCRGSPALQKFFTAVFEGVLITDFWAPYESVCAEDRQYCLVHLLRELEKVDLRNDSAEWRAFAKKLRRLLRDGMRLRKRPDFAPGKFQSRVDRLNARLATLAEAEHLDADTRRLTKRMGKYAEFIFTFLDYADVPFDNNFAERQIRPAVILRKNSQSNRSDQGAATQAVLMSVYRTLKLRGLNPTKT